MTLHMLWRAVGMTGVSIIAAALLALSLSGGVTLAIILSFPITAVNGTWMVISERRSSKEYWFGLALTTTLSCGLAPVLTPMFQAPMIGPFIGIGLIPLAALPPLLFLNHVLAARHERMRDQRSLQNQCVECGYPREPGVMTCSECGAEFMTYQLYESEP